MHIHMRRQCALCLQELSTERLDEYWYRLLTSYAQLQTFTPLLHPDAVPLEQALTNRYPFTPEQRTCRICKRLPNPT
jgi:hypothetical protein